MYPIADSLSKMFHISNKLKQIILDSRKVRYKRDTILNKKTTECHMICLKLLRLYYVVSRSFKNNVMMQAILICINNM